jgi:hypothetical protein
MKTRVLRSFAVAIACVGSTVLFADVKSQERTKVQFEGGLGKVVNLFGGRAAREGIVNTVAVKGDRMISTNETTGEIVDLREEKVYQLDIKKKTYTVVTFAELRQQLEDAMARARQQTEQARREESKQPEAKPDQTAKEYEVDFSVKETGRTRQIAGHDTKESIATVTVREKGKTLEDAGGMILEAAMWMAPEIKALEELQAFRLRYAQQVYGPVMAEAAPDMTQAMAMYPMMKDAMARFQAEGQKLSGTPLFTEMKFQVQAPPQSAGDQPQAEAQKKEEPLPTSVGGLMGGLGRRMAKKKPEESKDDPNAVPGRATVMTTTAETLQVATSVADGDVALPTGFKPK